jgi:membrane protease YdiL (CAAX protease family)
VSPTSTSEPPQLPDPPSGTEAPVAAVRPPSLVRAVLLDGLVAFLTLFAASFLLTLPLLALAAVQAAGGTRDLANVDFDALQQAILPQLTVASVFATLLAAALTWWLRARRLPRLAPMRAAVAYPLALVAGALVQIVCQGIVRLSDAGGVAIEPSNADPLEDLAMATPWLFWLVAVVVAPAAEELLFRHVLLRRFAVAGRAMLGVAVTSLLFALLHEPVPGGASWLLAVSLYTAMGAGFGAVYLRTGRLGAAVVAHAACNLVALIPAFSAL